MKKLLIITSTHGDERIGMEVINKLRKQEIEKYFDWLIANPRAYKKNQRFVDFDLNRAYPGDGNSVFYEKRRATEVMKIAQKYDFVIDLHEASAGINDFIVAPREKIGKKFPLNLVNMQKILLWPSPKGPLGSVLENTIELEFGMKNRKRTKVVEKATRIIERFINQITNERNKPRRGLRKNQKLFYVYGKLMKEKSLPILKDFKLIKIGKEQFFPLLVGQYQQLGIRCYKMRRVI